MDERAIFHTEYGVGISSLHPQTLGIQYLLKQSSQSSTVCLSDDKSLVFVSFKDKAIILYAIAFIFCSKIFLIEENFLELQQYTTLHLYFCFKLKKKRRNYHNINNTLTLL